MKKFPTFLVLLVALFAIPLSYAHAMEGTPTDTPSTTITTTITPSVTTTVSVTPTVKTRGEHDTPEPSTTPETGDGEGRGKLLGGLLNECEAHATGITQRSKHMTQMAQEMETKFSNVVQRVEQYYTTTVLPSGKSVSNYDALITAIQTQKAAVDAAVTKAQNDATNFSCSSTDPKGQVQGFKTDMQAVIQALKNYRTAIKNLITAIITVTGTGEGLHGETTTTPTISPTTSVTPSVTSTIKPTSE